MAFDFDNMSYPVIWLGGIALVVMVAIAKGTVVQRRASSTPIDQTGGDGGSDHPSSSHSNSSKSSKSSKSKSSKSRKRTKSRKTVTSH